MKKTVTVLMSTFNGEKYLKTQIDTILNQADVDVVLMVRDDGSTDLTPSILTGYSEKHKNIIYLNDKKRLGVGRSFITLLKKAPESDYYAYSDQDDIWHDDKLISAVNTMVGKDTPLLYCCNQNCVNGEGVFQCLRFKKEAMKSNLLQTVFNNYFAGCTMVMNKKLRDMIVAPDRCPDMDFFKVRIHDAWTACVAYAVGDVIFDETAHMDFRRHETAYSDEFAPGKKINKITLYIRKLKRYKRRGVVKNSIKYSALNLMKNYSDFLSEKERGQLNFICNYDRNFRTKIRLIRSKIFNNGIKGTKSTAIYKVLTGIL